MFGTGIYPPDPLRGDIDMAKTTIIKENVEISGVIKKIIFQNDTWSKVMLYIENEQVKGQVPVVGIAQPMEGIAYKIKGSLEEHEKYGRQINATSAIPLQDSNTIFVNFLAAFAKGIGGKTAIKSMTDAYGDKLLDVIRDNPDELLNLKHITPKRLEKIKKFYSDNFAKINTYRELYEALDGNGTPNQIAKIFDKYGDRSVDTIKENPYVLTEIEGFGFLTVDKLALASGVSEFSLFRFKSGLNHVLNDKANTNGHVFLTFDEIEEAVLDLLVPVDKEHKKMLSGYVHHAKKREDLTPYEEKYSEYVDMLHEYLASYEKCLEILSDAIVACISEGSLVLDDNRIYTEYLYHAEEKCAKKIAFLGRQKPIYELIDKSRVERALKKFEQEKGYQLDEEQISAVYRSYKSCISAITGGAGRGKTTITNLLIGGWLGKVVLCAPTGRAAQRMSEATGIEASTIHRLIYEYSGGKQQRKELPANSLIIVDESSMINLTLACDLLWSVKDSHIVFVGDADQLPPIGPGNFFAMLLKSRFVNVSRLEKAYRNMGSVNTNADMINHGKNFKSLILDERTRFKEIKDSDETAPTVASLWKAARQKYRLEDIRIITPTKKNGKSCANALNDVIRNIENPESSSNKIPGCRFRVGDRIMQTKNNYSISQYIDGKLQDGCVFNGECGTIVKYDQENDLAFIEMDTGEHLVYERSDMQSIDLSYATTVHKAQGSEYKCVIFVCMTEHFTMLKRNLIYTAVTRCKDLLLMTGMQKAYNIAIRDTQYKEIHCALTERIEEAAS